MASRCRRWCWHVGGLLVAINVANAERAYPLGCSLKGETYYDFENTSFPPGDLPRKTTDDYMLTRRLGAGKFSDVFEAVDVQAEKKLLSSTGIINSQRNQPPVAIDERTLVVLKCLKPVAERKIKRELLVLRHVSKLPNLARLVGIVVPPDFNDSAKKYHLQNMPSLVLEHAGVDSQWFCHSTKANHFLTDYEIRYFLYHLLIALDNLHSCGIMHRDVKPRNVLVDKTDMSLMLIDLGLADFFLPNTAYNVRVASRHYKSPELLLGFQYYDYAIDMWGVGCILAGLLLRREPFFRGKDNTDQLSTIVAVLGTADLHAYVSKYSIEMTPEVRNVIAEHTINDGSKKNWRSLLVNSNESLGIPQDYTPNEDGLDLLSKLLVYDHDVRLTAKQAMAHPFFDPVRDRVEEQVRETVRKRRET